MSLLTSSFRFPAVALAALLASISAHAVTTTFNFTGGGGTAGSYVFTSGALSVTVTATAFNPSTSTWDTSALVGRYSGGLGVTNSQKISGVAQDTNSPQHSLDNNGWKDLLVFQFSLPVDVDALSVGWYYNDDDFRYTIGSTYNSVKVLTGSGVTGTGLGNYWINGSNTVGSYFSVAAGQSSTEYNDYFKVSGLTVTYRVPDQGSTLVLAGLAMLGVAAFQKRRSSAAS